MMNQGTSALKRLHEVAFSTIRRSGTVLRARPAANCNKVAKKAVDGLEAHTYMALHSNGRGFLVRSRVRFVPLLGRYNRCPEQSNRGRMHVGSLTLLV